jgi:hypothetical protein
MKNLFTGRSQPDREQVERLKCWARMAWHVPEDATVMVTELECREPDCPPIETVVAVLQEGHPTKQYKIHKPIADVLEADLATAHNDVESAHHLEDHP